MSLFELTDISIPLAASTARVPGLAIRDLVGEDRQAVLDTQRMPLQGSPVDQWDTVRHRNRGDELEIELVGLAKLFQLLVALLFFLVVLGKAWHFAGHGSPPWKAASADGKKFSGRELYHGPLKMVNLGSMKAILRLLLRLLDLFYSPPPGNQAEEIAPPDEEEAIESVIRVIRARLDELWAGKGVYHRDVHIKAQGLCRAWFEVREDFPEALRHGVFAQNGRRFQSWVRFSNGKGQDQSDWVPDGRAIAIKVMGVDGQKIMEPEQDAPTQDFIMLNSSTFFIPNAASYVGFEIAEARGKQLGYLCNPFRPKLLERWRGCLIATIQATEHAESPLSREYGSLSAHKLGPHNMKFRVRPVSCADPPTPDKNDRDYLKSALQKQLLEGEALFDFEVQLQVPGKTMPIEDPTIEWRESDSPFVPVARLRLLQENIDSPERAQLSRDLSYNPWHSLAEHRPLGGINRLRKRVYWAVSEYRHAKNRAPSGEPSSWESGLPKQPAEA